MSGGFFRGTSAEQDTRFSNKQAKLLKSQKFPAELEHLVDIAKVKMDVVKPWIAKRVTELLGFEDEVLINFINGLLEGKDINGKQIQIQLTGFMEKHTSKFMKELWSLLLSAQNNASGVPQQFLDAKEEETRKKKEELDRIGNEMLTRKEKVAEHVNSRMDGGADDFSTAGPNLKLPTKDSNVHSDDEKEADIKNGFRRSSRSSRSPGQANRHFSPYRERNRPRNLSRSPVRRRNSISPERRQRSPQRSASDESLSPSPRRRSPSRRRSTSPSRNRSISPAPRKLRSPVYRRSSPGTRQSRSRSPRRRRSPSPWRRRSPSPVRRRSPYRRRRPSPSPRRRPSPSPRRRPSPSPRRRPSPSPRRRPSPSPRQGRSPPPWRGRSRSPRRRRSPSPWRRRSRSPRRHVSPSPVRRDRRRSPSSTPRPVRHRPLSPPRNGSRSRRSSPSLPRHKSPPSKHRSRRSPSPLGRKSLSPLKHRSPSPSPSLSPSRARSLSPVSGSSSPVKQRVPLSANLRSSNLKHRSSSPQSQPSVSPVRRSSSSSSGGDSTKMKKDHLQPPTDRSREQKGYKRKSSQLSVCSPRKEIAATHHNSFVERHNDDIKLRKKERDGSSSPLEKPAVLSPIDEQKEDEELVKLLRKDNMSSPTLESTGSEGSGKNRTIVTTKRKHRKLSCREIEFGSSSEDSEVEDRKEAKRRRKEEKRLRKDEKRRRREERRRHKEKRAHKRRSKDSDTMSSNSDKHENDVNASNRKTYSPDNPETESEKKRVENELREKALQNIRAKKGISR